LNVTPGAKRLILPAPMVGGGCEGRWAAMVCRLLAATYEGGISAIRITNNCGHIELDHLQYGTSEAPIPEPALLALLCRAAALLHRRQRL